MSNPLAGSPGAVIFKGMIVGDLGGLLIGSSFNDVNGEPYAAAGAFMGAGLMVGLGVLRNRHEWSLVGTTIAGAAAGTFIGAGAGAIADGKIVKGSAEDLAGTSRSGPYVAAGAVAGAALPLALGLLFPREGQRLVAPLDALLRPDGRVTLLQRGNRIGLRIRW